MINTDKILAAAQTDEETILGRRLCDMAYSVERGTPFRNTNFLTPAEQAYCNIALRYIELPYVFAGGFEQAERKILMLGQDNPAAALAALSAVEIYHKNPTKTLSHRDILGSVLALGLKREMVGDIIMGEETSTVIVMKSTAPLLLDGYTKAGRTGISVSEITFDAISPPEQKTELIRDTVASLRLDAVVASGFRMSRDSAARAIGQGMVSLNYRVCTQVSDRVGEGDIISVRGKGKLRLDRVGGESRKGRSWIEILRYL